MKIIIKEIKSCKECPDCDTCGSMISDIDLDSLNIEIPDIASDCPFPSVENSNNKMYMSEIDTCHGCHYRTGDTCRLVDENKYRDWQSILNMKQYDSYFGNHICYDSEIYPDCPLPDVGL